MAGLLYGDPSHQGMHEGSSNNYSEEKPEEGSRWYFSRKEIEENSPSKRDGIDLKKETYIRKSYCTFLQDLGMKLKVPQVTIATAIIFCHRFFLRQSHAKNDRRTIATVCMFLAGKVEETPRPLKDVIMVSYEIIHKKDPAAGQRIKQKEVYEQQKELILLGERVVLATLGFDLNVLHPYKPLVEAIKKFKVAQNALAQVAWNFVNDGLRTSLCLQFKPHHIAAGAIFLAAKFLKVKLPSDGEKVWWQEFDVTPRQLEEVSNQMLELYEQNRVPPSVNSEVEGSAGGGASSHRGQLKTPTSNEEHATSNRSQARGTTSRPGASKVPSSRPVSEQPRDDKHGGPPGNEYGSAETKSASADHHADIEFNDNQRTEAEPLPYQVNAGEAQNLSNFGSEGLNEEDQERIAAAESKDQHIGRKLEHRDGMLGQSPQEAIKKIDRDKVKAALEKQRKSRGDITRKTDLVDDDDIIERELEDGIEVADEREKNRRERRQSLSKPSNRPEHKENAGDGPHLESVEEGELSELDDNGQGFRSSNHRQKAGISPDKLLEGKQRHSRHYNYVEG